MLIKISRGYELIEGTWQDRDGSIMSITDRGFGKAPYSVRSVSNDGNYTVVTKCERKAPKFIYGDISSLKNNDSISLFFIVLYF